jgi:hypothetical protein
MSVISTRLTARVEAREGYGAAVAELEALDKLENELDRVRTRLLSGSADGPEAGVLRELHAKLQAEAEARIAALAVKLLDSRFVRELTLSVLQSLDSPRSISSVASDIRFRTNMEKFVVGSIRPAAASLGTAVVSLDGAVSLNFSSAFAPDPSIWLPSLFPWPPPEPSSKLVITNNEIPGWGRRFSTLGDLDDALRGALDRAGYAGPSYWGVRDGFALVTPLEQTDASGGPLRHEPSRWSVKIAAMKSFSLAEYVRALLTAPAGYFRVLAFVVTPHAFTTDGARGRFDVIQRWATAGHAFLPEALRRQQFSPEHRVTVLVYEFEKRRNADNPSTAIPGRHRAKHHLMRSSVMAHLMVRR